MKKVNFKLILIIILALSILLSIILMTPNLKDVSHIKNMNYSKVEIEIKIDTVDHDENIKNYIITVMDDTRITKVDANFLNNSTYIIDTNAYYEHGGRYKTFKVVESYRDLYDSIKTIELGESVFKENETVSYNPKIDKDVINKILKNLFIEIETERDESAYIVVEDDILKDFSINLIGIEGYRGINITISFSKLADTFSIDRPLIYKEATDEVEENRFTIIK